MRNVVAIACVLVALVAVASVAEDAAGEPSGHMLFKGTEKNVDSIIPEFKSGKEWEDANEKLKAGYNRVNEYFKKTQAAAYKAQGAKAKELNEKADKAQVKLKKAKEVIQKKYAHDNPADFGDGQMTSADIANKKLAAEAKNTDWGTYGASGTPGKMKWYTDGVISSNAYVDKGGHYQLGASRRRIGAGFGRRRRVGDDKKKVTRVDIKTAEKGHDLLKAMGKVDTASSKDTDDIIKGMDKKTAAAYKAMHSATKHIKVKLPKGVTVAKKKFVSPEDAKVLKATGAGADAQVDKTAHFTKETDDKIVGEKQTAALTGDKKAEEFSDAEVMELIQDAFQ